MISRDKNSFNVLLSLSLLVAAYFFVFPSVTSAVSCHQLTKEQDKIQDLQTSMDRLAKELEQEGDLISPRKWRDKSAQDGLPGLDLPKRFGGQGWSFADTVKIFEFAGRFDLNLRDIVGGGHARLLLGSKHPEVQQIVKDVAAGKAYVAIAMTERHAGSDTRNIQSKAFRVDGGYKIFGEKMYNARLSSGATHVVIFTRMGESHLQNAFVLPINHPGLRFTELEAGGLHGNSFGGVKFDGVFVPKKYMVAPHGEAASLFNRHFTYWRLAMAATAVGTAMRALDMGVHRLNDRQVYGQPIGNFTHLQQPIGQAAGRLLMAQTYIAEAAKKYDRKEDISLESVVAKGEAVEIALEAVDHVMRIFGAEGYSQNVDVMNRHRDLQGLRVADGTTDVMRGLTIKLFFEEGDRLWQMVTRPSSP